MSARLALLLVAPVMVTACSATGTAGPSASGEPQRTASPAPSPSPTHTPLPAGAVAFRVVPDRSLATIRVREQVASIPAPGDAVLTSRAFRGSLVMQADGTFAPGSTISIDLDTLSSDSALRDEWIKINTLQTRQFPRAEFTALSVSSLPLPLPTSGEWKAELRGTMRIHGVDRELTWLLQVTRANGEVRALGTTSFRFGDYAMTIPADRMILSVVDHVQLEIDMVARQPMSEGPVTAVLHRPHPVG